MPATRPVTDADLSGWRERGWLHLPGAISPERLAEVTAAVVQVEAWAAEVNAGETAPGLHHWEMTDGGPALARSEDLIGDSPVLRDLICAGPLLEIAGALFEEPAVLFKEKINYKQPGGAGFAPHQDAAAYRFVDHHVSCMVPLDPATEASGCLSVVSGAHAGFLPTDPGGCIDADVAAGLAWEAAEVQPGDLLWFDSYTPHRSDTNRTERPRRALYLTYNAASQGEFRERYYADKRAEFAAEGGTFGDERVRISITADFLGRPVPGAR